MQNLCKRTLKRQDPKIEYCCYLSISKTFYSHYPPAHGQLTLDVMTLCLYKLLLQFTKTSSRDCARNFLGLQDWDINNLTICMHQCINVLAAHFVKIDMSILLPNIYAYFILKKIFLKKHCFIISFHANMSKCNWLLQLIYFK
jgi:hypothetical protein